jgi:hypothetical protein
MVRRHSVVLPSLFPRPRSRRQDLTGRPLSSPMWQPLDRSASPYLSLLGRPLRSVGLYKGETLPRCVHCQVSPAFEFDSVATLIFPLWLVLANPLLVHFCCCFAHSPSKLVSRFRTTSRRSSKKTGGRTRLHRRPCPRSWRSLSPSAGRL